MLTWELHGAYSKAARDRPQTTGTEMFFVLWIFLTVVISKEVLSKLSKNKNNKQKLQGRRKSPRFTPER